MVRASVLWSVIVEAEDSHKAIASAMTAVAERNCNPVMPYQIEAVKHPDSGQDAWRVRLRADCETDESGAEEPRTMIIGEYGARRIDK